MDARKTRASLNHLPTATGVTLDEYERTLAALAGRLLEIKKMTEKYPVFLFVAGQGYRFEGPEHVDQFVAMLRREIEKYLGRPSLGPTPATSDAIG